MLPYILGRGSPKARENIIKMGNDKRPKFLEQNRTAYVRKRAERYYLTFWAGSTKLEKTLLKCDEKRPKF
jgi:hypothetical protein